MTLTEFCLAVFAYCTIADASVVSWIRTRRRNLALEGVDHSGHLVGLAVDVIYDVPPPLAERRQWAERLGLFLHVEEGRDHLQPAGWRPG